MSARGPFEVLVAGAGVAGLEGMLSLRELAAERVAITLVSPAREFAHKPPAVAEPFGLGSAERLDVGELCAGADVDQLHDRLVAVDAEQGTIRTAGQAELAYDALLLTPGAVPRPELEGALNYAGQPSNAEVSRLLAELRGGACANVAFALPTGAAWPLPVYELALLTAAHLREHAAPPATLRLTTPEPAPLAAFGRAASRRVAAALREAGIELHTSAAPASVRDGALRLASGAELAADRVVTVARLEVEPIPGVPQGLRGFIGTDREMRVDGLERVYAAGDATWFPVKLGGLAAQQAAVAATSIAIRAGAGLEPASFHPVLRAILLTGAEPLHLRSEAAARDSSSRAGTAPLWWPPAKTAGGHLAALLAGAAPEHAWPPLVDLATEPVARRDDEHREALAMALRSADIDAEQRDFAGALRWLEAARRLNMTLPIEYRAKRVRWEEISGRAP